MTATSLAIVGHLGQIIAIAVVVLIASGILIWARWRRRPPDEFKLFGVGHTTIARLEQAELV
jgi:uncharacterized membrane protein